MLDLRDLAFARLAMVAEAYRDKASGAIYRFPRFTDEGFAQYPALLLEALEHHDDEWLADQIKRGGLLKTTEMRRGRNGGETIFAKVPYTAATTLAEGEFNRYYIRGVCWMAVDEGDETVIVYRAKEVENPRPQSQALIGTHINAADLLNDLREHPELDRVLGVPAGPNSGLSVHRI